MNFVFTINKQAENYYVRSCRKCQYLFIKKLRIMDMQKRSRRPKKNTTKNSSLHFK